MVLIGVVRRVPVYEAFKAQRRFQSWYHDYSLSCRHFASIGCFGALVFRRHCGLDFTHYWSFGNAWEALPLAIMRPLSGSGALGLTSELIQTHGPDSYIGNLVSTMQGSTETTFYVLAVYFGSVGAPLSPRHVCWIGMGLYGRCGQIWLFSFCRLGMPSSL